MSIFKNVSRCSPDPALDLWIDLKYNRVDFTAAVDDINRALEPIPWAVLSAVNQELWRRPGRAWRAPTIEIQEGDRMAMTVSLVNGFLGTGPQGPERAAAMIRQGLREYHLLLGAA